MAVRVVISAVAFVVLTMAAEEGPRFYEIHFPKDFDPFAAEAGGMYRRLAEGACAAPKTDGFAGYRWTLPPIARPLRTRPGSGTGQEIYLGFLKSKYGYQIAELNRAYQLDAQSFTELLEGALARVDPDLERVLADDAEFEAAPRREILRAMLAALRRCDPPHAGGAFRSIPY